MKKIYKYKIQYEIEKIHAPIVNFLTVQVQNDTICVWAEIDTDIADYSFIVEDIKQCIYRWRTARPDLLQKQIIIYLL